MKQYLEKLTLAAARAQCNVQSRLDGYPVRNMRPDGTPHPRSPAGYIIPGKPPFGWTGAHRPRKHPDRDEYAVSVSVHVRTRLDRGDGMSEGDKTRWAAHRATLRNRLPDDWRKPRAPRG